MIDLEIPSWNTTCQSPKMPVVCPSQANCEGEIWKALLSHLQGIRDPQVIHIRSMAQKALRNSPFFLKRFPMIFVWSLKWDQGFEMAKLSQISVTSKEFIPSPFYGCKMWGFETSGFLCLKTLRGCIGRHIFFLKGSRAFIQICEHSSWSAHLQFLLDQILMKVGRGPKGSCFPQHRLTSILWWFIMQGIRRVCVMCLFVYFNQMFWWRNLVDWIHAIST